jgi:hypothetical protein
MDEVIPWWRQNFIEEFGALAADVVVENTDEANFLGGTEEDRKLTKERIQAIPNPCSLQYSVVFVFACISAGECFCSRARSSGCCRCTGQTAVRGCGVWNVTFIFAG